MSKKLKPKKKPIINCKVRNKLNGEYIISFCETFVLHYRDQHDISNKLLKLISEGKFLISPLC